MYLRHDSRLFVFCFLFCYFCGWKTRTRTAKVSTEHSSEKISLDDSSDELSTNSLSDDDVEEEEEKENDDAFLRFLVVLMPLWLPLTGIAITSIVAGIVVSNQWPHPRFCCWTQTMSDKSHGCCGFPLYRMNVFFALKSILYVALLYITNWTILFSIPVAFFMWHYLTIFLLGTKFDRFGWPIHRENDAEAPLVDPPPPARRRDVEDILFVQSGTAGYR